jgi:TolA-binding protein
LNSRDAKVLPTALYWNANTLRALNRHNDAAASYRRLLSEYSNHALAPRAALRLGDTLADASDAGGAAEAYRVVLTKYAKTDAAREAQEALVALASGAVGDSSATAQGGNAALEQVLRALPAGPATSNAQLKLAQAAYAGGNWTRAAQLAQTAIAGKPDAATAENARYLLASAKLRGGDATGAATAFRAQLTAAPQGALAAQARLGLAWALLEAKKWSEAEAAARAASTSQAKGTAAVREQARLALGEALLRGGKAKDALTVFASASQSANKETAAQGAYGAALSLEAQKQWGAAGAQWSKLASLTTENSAKARAYFQQAGAGQSQAGSSLAAFDKAISIDPKGELAARALYESAWAAHDLKQAAQETARWTRLANEYSNSSFAAEANLQRGEALSQRRTG